MTKSIILVLALTIFTAFKSGNIEISADFKKYYEPYNFEGWFALYDSKNNKYIL